MQRSYRPPEPEFLLGDLSGNPSFSSVSSPAEVKGVDNRLFLFSHRSASGFSCFVIFSALFFRINLRDSASSFLCNLRLSLLQIICACPELIWSQKRFVCCFSLHLARIWCCLSEDAPELLYCFFLRQICHKSFFLSCPLLQWLGAEQQTSFPFSS